MEEKGFYSRGERLNLIQMLPTRFWKYCLMLTVMALMLRFAIKDYLKMA